MGWTREWSEDNTNIPRGGRSISESIKDDLQARDMAVDKEHTARF
jgi:hypothetical protein